VDYDEAIFLHEALAILLLRRRPNSGLERPVDQEGIGFLRGMSKSRQEGREDAPLRLSGDEGSERGE